MRLPLFAWKNTLGKLNRRVVHKKTPRQKASRRVGFEQAEPRIMWTVTPSYSSGLLTIHGDSANDTITVASANVGGTDYVTVNGTQFGSLAAASVMGITVEGGSGNDSIDLSGVLTAKFTGLTNGSIEVQGEDGNDTLIGTTLADNLDGGIGNDTLTGGAGNDMLTGGGNSDTYIFAGGSNLGSDTLIETNSSPSDTLNFGGLSANLTVDLGLTSLQTVASGLLSLTLSNADTFEHVLGGSGNDNFTGNSRDNTFEGGAGNDILAGGSGSDTYLFSGSSNLGSDTITEAADLDSDTLDLSGMSANLTVSIASTSTQTVATSLLSLTLSSTTGLENVFAGSGHDTITGNTLDNWLVGGAGNDTISAGTGRDTLEGGLGNDALTGGGNTDYYLFSGNSNLGTDTITESANLSSSDTLDFSGMSANITVDISSTSSQTVASGLLTLVLSTTTGIERVVGGSGNDTITGNTRDNFFEGGAGNDTIAGGSGSDVYSFLGSTDLGSDTITEGTNADTDYLDFAGMSANLTVDINSTSSQTVATSLLTLTLSDATGIENIIGGSGSDALTGNSRDNALQGGAGNDTLAGGTGSDTYVFVDIVALGSDTITEAATADSDTLDFSGFIYDLTVDLGSTSAQTIVASILTLTLSSATGIENIVGGTGNDTITGNTRDNALTGGAGDDAYIFAGSSNLGSDTITEAAGVNSDTLDFTGMSADLTASIASTSTQTVAAGLLSLTLSSTTGLDHVLGGSGNDTITGNTLGNWLVGNAGNDTISGDSGSDLIEGGAGDDSLTGGGNSDVFVYAGNSNLGSDTITEASGTVNDMLDFSGMSANLTVDLSSTSTQTVAVGLVVLTLSSSTGIERAIGGSGNDTLTGNTRNNLLIGGAGNDTLAGGSGSDTYVYGGNANLGSDTITEASLSHSDTLDFAGMSEGLTVDMSSTSAQTVAAGLLTLTFSTVTSIENIIGGSGNDTIKGNARNNSLAGGGGNDAYVFAGGSNLGTDTITEADDADSDTLDFSGMSAGLTVDLSSTSSQTVASGLLTLEFSSATGIENAIGGSGNDSLTGNTRDNRLEGKAGTDTLAGGAGSDTYVFAGASNLGSDAITEGAGADSDTLDFSGMSAGLTVDLNSTSSQTVAAGLLTLALSNSTAIENVLSGSGNDSLMGNSRDNYFAGYDGNDFLDGGAGDDTMFGGAGNDNLKGGLGFDAMYGDDGEDDIEYDSGPRWVVSLSDDYQGSDRYFPQAESYIKFFDQDAGVRSSVEVEARTWKEALEKSLEDLRVAGTNTFDDPPTEWEYSWADDGGRFRVGTYEEVAGSDTDFGFFIDPDAEVIIFEDYDDGDFDETMWYVGWQIVNSPEVDVDVDSNNDLEIDPDNDPETGTDDPIEENHPGKIIGVNGALAPVELNPHLLEGWVEAAIYAGIEGVAQLRLRDGSGGEILTYWNDASGTTELDEDHNGILEWWSLDDVPATIWVQGIAVGTESLTLELRAGLTESFLVTIASDVAKVTVVQVDLDVDSNNDGSIDSDNDPETGTDDPIEMSLPGKVILLNYDDDDGNSVSDMDQEGPISGENDLVQAKISYPSSVFTTNDPLVHELVLSTPNPQRIRVYANSNKTDEIDLSGGDMRWTIGGGTIETPPSSVWIEGIQLGVATLKLELYQQGGAIISSDTVRVSVIDLDLDVDSNNDGTIDPDNDVATGTDDPIEEDSPGKLVGLNNDDDDGNGVSDLNQAGPITGENNLVQAIITYPSSAFSASEDVVYELVLSTNSPSKIRVYTASNKTGLIDLSSGEKYWTIGGGTIQTPPASIWIEGIATGEAEVKLEIKREGGGVLASDKVKMTVIAADLDVDSDNDGSIAAPDDPIEEQAPGKLVVLNNDDDNNDGVLDFDQAGPIVGENNLVEAKLNYPASLFDADDDAVHELVLDTSNFGMIRVYASANKTGLLIDELSGAYRWTIGGDTIQTPPSSVWIEGLVTGEVELSLNIHRVGGGDVTTDKVKLTVIRVDLDVDTNRDNDITNSDDTGEDQWISTGATAKGAVILLNADDDDSNDIPDNWWGGDLDGDGTADAADDEVNGAADVGDIGPLWFHKLGIATLPQTLTVTLKVETVPGEDAYWTSRADHDAPEERVRIFLPDLMDGNNIKIQSGNNEIIGPSTGDEYVFTYNPGMPDHFAIFEGNGIVKFGIEGIHSGAPVLITATVKADGNVLSTDTVQVKVSSWIAFSHKQDVDVDGTPNETVWVADLGADNVELRTDLNALFPGRVEEFTVQESVFPFQDDIWYQDPFEMGYVQAPYGQMAAILVLPRAQRNTNAFNDYAREIMMIDGVGLITSFAFTGGAWDNQDDGGNFEVQPDVGKPLGTIVMATGPNGSMDTDIVDFLIAQGVQDVISDLDLSWMALGHTDEVVSFQSDAGNRARVASPEAAWALLVIAKEVYGKGGEYMLQDLNGLGAGGRTIDDILADTTLRADNFDVGGYSDHIVQDVRDKLGLISPVSTPTAVGAPAGTLRRAGYLDVFDTIYTYGDEIEWKLTFTSANDYTISHRKAGTTTWVADGSGSRTADSFSTSQAIYILTNWWEPTKATAAGNEILFTTKPSPNMIEMPVLFYDNGGAQAYTNNVVNSIVHGDKLLLADVAGPDVGGTIGDIFDDYVHQAAVLVGFTTVEKTKETLYHNGCGSIHCGTNVIREIEDNWWENL